MKNDILTRNREKIEDYLRFLTRAGETRFPIFACGNLPKLCYFVARLDGMLTLTLEIVQTIPDPMTGEI